MSTPERGSPDLASVADLSPILRTMQYAEHGLFVVLLAIGAVRGAEAAGQPFPIVIGALVLLAWYALGLGLAVRHRARRLGYLWLAGLVLGWLALVLVSAEFSWVAFALFFLSMHLLPVRAAVPLVIALTAAVVWAQLAIPGGNTAAKVLGPTVGALVAVGMALVYRQLLAVSEQRRLLVDQLVAAQDDLVATHDALAATQREAGALAERARLARDIHDTLAQGFSSIVLLSRAGLAAPSAELFGQIEATAADNLVEARRVVHALTPAALEEAPLPAALQRLLDRMTEQTGVRTELRIDGDPVTLPTSYEVALLRLAQSALANVRLHAAAGRLALTLTYQPDSVRLDVVDDGRGFDPSRLADAPLGGTGFGLRAMRQRLVELGGTFTVETAPGEGTAVAARIPLRTAEPEKLGDDR